MLSNRSDEPDFYRIITREAVEALADRDDALGVLAREMTGSADGEEAVFLRGVRPYFHRLQGERRRALTNLAGAFGVGEWKELKRYLKFKGVLNEGD